jgi:hypothetical protein
MPVRLSFWHIVGLFSGVSCGIIQMQYVMRRMRDRIDSDWFRVAPLATVAIALLIGFTSWVAGGMHSTMSESLWEDIESRIQICFSEQHGASKMQW